MSHTIHIPKTDMPGISPLHGAAQINGHLCPACSIIFERVNYVPYPPFMHSPRIQYYNDERRMPMWNHKDDFKTLVASVPGVCHLCSMFLAHFSRKEREILERYAVPDTYGRMGVKRLRNHLQYEVCLGFLYYPNGSGSANEAKETKFMISRLHLQSRENGTLFILLEQTSSSLT